MNEVKTDVNQQTLQATDPAQTTALAKPEEKKTEAPKTPVLMGEFGLELKSLDEAWRLCNIIATSGFAPKSYENKPEKIFIALQMGAELGMKPMAALQSIGIVNGIPALYGDGFLGKCMSHPAYEWHKEWYDGEGDQLEAFCQVKRRGNEPHTISYTVKEAKDAGLWTKDVWKKHPKRMLLWRARTAFRDKFADILKGFKIYEEVLDYPEDAHNSAPVQKRPEFDDEPAQSMTAPPPPAVGNKVPVGEEAEFSEVQS